MIPIFFDDVLAPTSGLFRAEVAALIESVAPDFVILAEIQPMEKLGVWTPAGGGLSNTYSCAFSTQIAMDVVAGGLYRRLDFVRQDDTDLGLRSDAASVNANLGSYYLDTLNGRLYVSTTSGAHPDTYALVGAWFSIFFANTSVSFNDFPFFEPRLTGALPTLSSEMPDPLFGSRVSDSGTLEIVNTDKAFDKLARRFVWRNKKVTLRLGGRALDYADFDVIDTMRVNAITVDDELATLQLEYAGSVLNRSLPSRTWGDGTFTGSPDPAAATSGTSGMSQPIVLGLVVGCPCAYAGQVGGVDRWLMYDANASTYGFCQVVTAYAYNRSTQVGLTLAPADWAVSGAAIDILNPTYTHDDWDIIVNLRQLGTLASPTFGTMAVALLRLCGEMDENIDLAAFAAADVQAPQVLAKYISEPTVGADLMDELCQSVGGQVYKGLDGRWTCRLLRPDIPSSYATLMDADFVSWTPTEDLKSALNELRVRYSHLPATDDWVEASASDDSVLYGSETSDSHRIDSWLTTSADASALAQQLLFFNSTPSMTIEAEQRSLGLMRAQAGDLVSVVRSRGPIARTGTLDGQFMRIVKIEKSLGPQTPVVRVWLNDLGGQTDRIARYTDGVIAASWATATTLERAQYGFYVNGDGYIDANDPLTRHGKVAS